MISIHSKSFTLTLNRQNDRTQRTLQTTFKHLASGIRIVDAKDDVAGSMITERLTAQMKGALQSHRNIMEGISLVQVLDAALNEQEKVIMRMRELGIQASSEHLTDLERRHLNQEFTALNQSLTQISEQTHYNNIHLLDRSHRQLEFQVGGTEEESFTLSLYDARVEELGRQARYDGARRGVFVDALNSNQMHINDISIRGSEATDDLISYSYADGSAIAKAAAINASTEFTGVRAIVQATRIEGFEPIQKLELSQQDYFKINGHAISGFMIEDKDATGSLEELFRLDLESTDILLRFLLC